MHCFEYYAHLISGRANLVTILTVEYVFYKYRCLITRSTYLFMPTSAKMLLFSNHDFFSNEIIAHSNNCFSMKRFKDKKGWKLVHIINIYHSTLSPVKQKLDASNLPTKICSLCMSYRAGGKSKTSVGQMVVIILSLPPWLE